MAETFSREIMKTFASGSKLPGAFGALRLWKTSYARVRVRVKLRIAILVRVGMRDRIKATAPAHLPRENASCHQISLLLDL